MKKRLMNYLIFIGKIFFCTYIVYVLVSQQPVIDSKKRQKDLLLDQLEDAKNYEIELRTSLGVSDTDEYVEQMAREKLGLLKPGERVFIDIRK